MRPVQDFERRRGGRWSSPASPLARRGAWDECKERAALLPFGACEVTAIRPPHVYARLSGCLTARAIPMDITQAARPVSHA